MTASSLNCDPNLRVCHKYLLFKVVFIPEHITFAVFFRIFKHGWMISTSTWLTISIYKEIQTFYFHFSSSLWRFLTVNTVWSAKNVAWRRIGYFEQGRQISFRKGENNLIPKALLPRRCSDRLVVIKIVEYVVSVGKSSLYTPNFKFTLDPFKNKRGHECCHLWYVWTWHF